jgi:hypothetical protein
MMQVLPASAMSDPSPLPSVTLPLISCFCDPSPCPPTDKDLAARLKQGQELCMGLD